MKRKLLLIGIIVILSGSSVFAECTSKGGCPLSDLPECMKIKPCANLEMPCIKKDNDITCPFGAKKYQNFICKTKRNRATVYNALDLTEEQVRQREAITNKNTPLYEEKFSQLIKESFKVKALKEAGASDREINNQKKAVKNVKKDIEELLNREDKEFKKCLTHEQRSKYSMIKKLERKDLKDSCHRKDYYKSNPKMRPFGNVQK